MSDSYCDRCNKYQGHFLPVASHVAAVRHRFFAAVVLDSVRK